MYNDNYNCKVPDEGCSIPVPTETMKDVVIDLHDKMMKARVMSDDIAYKLFGCGPIKENEPAMDGNCAYDALFETRRIANYVLETLYAVNQRIEG